MSEGNLKIESYCIISSVSKSNADPFKLNYAYLCDQSRKAIFGIKQKIKSLGNLQPHTMFYLFNTCIKPILIYGSDVWGVYSLGRDLVDKLFLNFIKCTLGIKKSTCTLMVYGESGQLPASIDCLYNTSV